MVSHVKLEIAIQLVAEKIAAILTAIEGETTEEGRLSWQAALDEAFFEKEQVAIGNIYYVNKILSEKRN